MDRPPKRPKASSSASQTNALMPKRLKSNHLPSSSSTTMAPGPTITYDENTTQEATMVHQRNTNTGDDSDDHIPTYTGAPHSLSLQIPNHHVFPNASNFVIKDSTFIYGGSPQDLRKLKDYLLDGIKTVDSRATECIEGTRTTILDNIATKIDDCDNTNIIWIRGAPGSGKSSISLSAKSRLRSQGQLATYFRFDRNEAATTTPTALWRRVANDLARRLPSFRAQLLQQLRDDRLDLDSPMALLKSFLSDLTDVPPDNPLVIIIDALDECGGLDGRLSPDRKVLLDTLACWAKLPKKFKLLVTSREESDIERVLSSISVSIDIPSGYSLTENPDTKASLEASSDIRTFLEGRFQDIRKRCSSLPSDWPGTMIISEMVCRAAGIFMWATTAMNFIDCRSIDPEGRLHKIMGKASEPTSMKPLYSLYATVLETSFGDILNGEPEADVLKSVLGTMVLAKRPFHDIEYTKLPTASPVTRATLDFIRDGLRSVVAPGALRFLHKSFDDFLLSEECPEKYAIRKAETQYLLTKLCLTTMTAELRFNICGLGTSSLKNADMPDIETKVRERISSLLSYSCCFWADHLIRTPFDEYLMDPVKDMVYDKLLCWFEVMSLLKEITRVSHSLLLVLNWSNSATHGKCRDFIRDAHRFIGAFGHPIALSAPHIYISALPFAPKHSSVTRHFLPQFPQILALSIGKPTDWSPCVFTSEHHDNCIYSVAFSPDEKYFVSGSQDETMCVCDSETGNLISGPFNCNDLVISSFFDPDGRHVWASCWDGQVIGWDIETGDEYLRFRAGGDFDVIGCCCFNGSRNIVFVSKFKGTVILWSADTGKQLRILLRIPCSKHSQVSFSSDGCYMAWAGNGATTVRIWKLVDGSEIRSSQSQLGHMRPISILSFSVDGHFIVSGSTDGTILVWDAKTGDVVDRLLTSSKASRMSAVAYSHENRILVSASGNPGTIMVWTTSTHEAVLGPLEGHAKAITAIALSRDGRRSLSASADGTVRMWDLSRKGDGPAAHPNEGHTGWVKRVVFSPCGKKLASAGHDETIRVWDASTGKRLIDPINSLLDCDGIMFSPDSSQIVGFNSDGGNIKAWNVDTGASTCDHGVRDDNYEDSGIEHVAFRSADQRLVTCSRHGIVRAWSLEDGILTEDLSASSPQPEDASNSVKIVALSPDGMTAIVYDVNRHPHRYYLWSTTTCQPLPLTFVDGKHISGDWVAFSPNGRFLAAASINGGMTTLRIWNTRTGELAAGCSSLNRELWYLTFSPDDRHIAFSYFSSTDTTSIRILDVHTGNLASGPWKGHTNKVSALAFSPDGEKLASCSSDGQIRIWNTTDLLGHSQAFVEGFRDETRIETGWVVGESGELLFWVPKDHREGLFWPRNIAVFGGSGIPTQLDLTRFRYGESWTECLGGGK